MGNGLFNAPPTPDPGSLPDVPVTDFLAQAVAQAKGLKKGGFIWNLLILIYSSVIDGIGAIIGFLVGGLDDVLAQVLKVVFAFQGIGQPGQVALMGAILGDLLGLEVNSEDLVQTLQKGGRIKAMKTAGSALFDVFYREFAPPGGTTEITSSQDPARAFMGFLIEFAVRQGNLATISELIPEEFNFMGGLREYGELLARNLGLGRMARRALQPLIQTMVATPLQWNLNELYQPTILSAPEAIRAWARGAMSTADRDANMRKHGYAPAAVQQLLLDNLKFPSLDDLIADVRQNPGDVPGMKNIVRTQGYTDANAELVWNGAIQARLDPLIHSYLNELRTMYRNGFIQLSDVSTILDGLYLLPEERTWWLRIIQNAAITHTKHLSEGEIERAYLEGLTDMSQTQDLWKRYGYSDESIRILTLLLLQKQAGGTRTSSGHKPTHHLTVAELEKAYKLGIMTLAAVQAYWATLGYSPADIQTLTALMQAPPASSGGTSTPPAPAP